MQPACAGKLTMRDMRVCAVGAKGGGPADDAGRAAARGVCDAGRRVQL